MASIIDPTTLDNVRAVGRAVASGIIAAPVMSVGDYIDVTDDWETLVSHWETRKGETCPVRVLDLLTGVNVSGAGNVRNAMHAQIVRALRKVNGDASRYVRLVANVDGTDRVVMRRDK